MSFLDSLFRRFGYTLHAGDIETLDVLMEAETVNSNTAMKLSAVHTAVKGISETISSMPAQVLEKQGDRTTVNTEHSLNMVLRYKPNNFQTPQEFYEQMMAYCLLRGKCPTQIIRNGVGDIVQLINLDPDRMDDSVDDDGNPIYLYKKMDGTDHAFKADQIMMVRNFLGLSPIDISAQVFNHASNQQNYSNKYIENGCAPSGVITRDRKWKDSATRKRFLESWKKAYASASKAGKTILLEDGMDWKPISVNAEQSQFLESRKFSKEEVLSIFRYPPHLAGNMEQMKFANVSQMFRSYLQLTILPWLKRIEQAIQNSLLTPEEFDKVFVRFNMESLLRADYKERMEGNRIAIESGQLTPNEARAQDDRPPLPGGDDLRGPLNFAPLTATSSETSTNESESEAQDA